MELLLKGKNGYKASVMVRGEGLLSFCNGCGMERFGATGGASSSPTKSEWDRSSINFNPHRLDGKKYCNFGNSPVNYKMKML